MARNEEKHYGRLNRLYLLKEKEEYEKANPNRPRLETLCSVEEVRKWLPSIKKDIDFYLKKSQVTCYSDAHVEECREKLIKLEKEFKAFVRKIKQLNPSPLDAIPWTNRPYKRKKNTGPSVNIERRRNPRRTNWDSYKGSLAQDIKALEVDSSEKSSNKEFKRIATPILDNEVFDFSESTSQWNANWNLMNKPLSFSNKDKQTDETSETTADISLSSMRDSDHMQHCSPIKNVSLEKSDEHKISEPKKLCNIVSYDSSDCDDS